MARSPRERRMWAAAFARQGLADLEVREALRDYQRCYQLHFLQMAAEKVCKAHLHAIGDVAGFSYAVIRKHLPTLARTFGPNTGLSGSRMKQIKLLAAEIELLAPALRAQGSREDNTEYPWGITGGPVIAPIDFAFESIEDREVISLIKVLRSAAIEYAGGASVPDQSNEPH